MPSIIPGIPNSETIHCNENGYYSIYLSDRYGFNNPDSEWDKKEIEYLLVGDSFVHGACVNRPNDLASVLRLLSNKTVLNLGYSGYGPLNEYVILREYLNSNVKNVLWVYFENDLGDLEIEIKNNILINYLNDLTFSQNLKLKKNEIENVGRGIIESLYNSKILEIEIQKTTLQNAPIEIKKQEFKSKLIKFMKIFYTRQLIFIPPIIKTPVPSLTVLSEFEKILHLTKDLTTKNNSKLYFVYLPAISAFNLKYDKDNYNLIKNIIKELNIPFIDVAKEVFEKEKNPSKFLTLEPVGHYNELGYKKVAEYIYQFSKF